jgi:hypothetical protein
MKDVGQDNRVVERDSKATDAGMVHLLRDDHIMGEIAAGAAIGFRHRGTEEAGGACLAPDFRADRATLFPFMVMGNALTLEEAPGGLGQKLDILAEP